MKVYKILFFVLLIFFASLFFIKVSKNKLNEKEYIKPLQKSEVSVNNHLIKEVERKQRISNQYLYNKSKKAETIHSELQELFYRGDYHAAQQLVKNNTICSIASLGEDMINEIITGIGTEILKDESGRLFFNQSLIFIDSNIKTIDDIYDSFSRNLDYCEGFVKDDYSLVFRYLMLGARNGDTNSMLALWGMEDPIYINQKLQYNINKNKLEYLKLFDEEQKWNDMKTSFLYRAADLGDARSWVLLGDALSSKSILPPNLNEAYKYYYAASLHYDFLFIDDKLSTLEKFISLKDVERLKDAGKKMYENN
jgi:hypothetical protein